MERTRREQTIEQVAGIITENLEPYADSATALRQVVRVINGDWGWAFEVRWSDQEYINETDYTRVEGAVLSDADLDRALALAESWVRA